MFAGGGDDFVDSGDDNDQVLGEAGRDTLILGPGNDFAGGDSANTTYTGASNAYDDFINGGDGNDTVYGDDGADVLIGGAGSDANQEIVPSAAPIYATMLQGIAVPRRPGQPTRIRSLEKIVKNFSTAVKLAVASCAVAAGLLAIAPATATPVLLGNGTFNILNDLTVIQDGNQTLEFLDLTTTRGQSVDSALAAYGGDGFRWANGGEVAALYGAFGFTYGSTALSFVILDVPAPTASNFVDYLGSTFGDASLGWIDDFTTDFYHTYSCISVNTCTADFVENTASFWPSTQITGVYLVRDQRLSIPEPGTIAMLSISLVGLLAARLSSRMRSGRHIEAS